MRKQPRAEDLATIVYTSGTTGNPKGAMLTHGNIASNAMASLKVLPIEQGLIAMSILPLSHILERMADYCYFIRGCTIAYAESVNKVGENLQEVKPHLFAAVPRLFEKMRSRIMDGVAENQELMEKRIDQSVKLILDKLPRRLAS